MACLNIIWADTSNCSAVIPVSEELKVYVTELKYDDDGLIDGCPVGCLDGWDVGILDGCKDGKLLG